MTSGGGTDRVMVDIETLGLEPGAAILSIGAVRFALAYRPLEQVEDWEDDR